MTTVLTVLATLGAYQLAKWVWHKRPQYDLDQWIVRHRPNLTTRRAADMSTMGAVEKVLRDQRVITERLVAEALATIVDDPRTPEEQAEFKVVFERVHADDRFKDLPPTQQTAAARRIQKLGMERLGFVDVGPSKPKSGRESVPA